MPARASGVTSASIIVVVLVGAFVGALVGGSLDSLIANKVLLAVASGLAGTLVAAIVRFKLLFRVSGAGPDESRIPGVLLVNGVIASIAGSLAGYTLAGQLDSLNAGGIVGALAGLLSGVLMAILMVTYYTIPSTSALDK